MLADAYAVCCRGEWHHLRCAIEQGEHLFITLRLRKHDVEMVRFPAESHELSRSGSPPHRVERFQIILEWFDRYLKR